MRVLHWTAIRRYLKREDSCNALRTWLSIYFLTEPVIVPLVFPYKYLDTLRMLGSLAGGPPPGPDPSPMQFTRGGSTYILFQQIPYNHDVVQDVEKFIVLKLAYRQTRPSTQPCNPV